MEKDQRKFRMALFGVIAAVVGAVGGGWAVHIYLSVQSNSISATNGGVVNQGNSNIATDGGVINRVVPLDNFMIYKDIIRLDRPD